VEASSIVKDIALAVVAAVLGFIPWFLDKRGVEMNRHVLSLIFACSMFLLAWALAKLSTHITSQSPRISLIGAALLVAASVASCLYFAKGLEQDPFAWRGAAVPLHRIQGKHFNNEQVLLDGTSYVECTFTNVTLIYNGTAPYRLEYITTAGTVNIRTDNPAISNMTGLLYSFGYFKKSPLTTETGLPSTNYDSPEPKSTQP